MTYIKLIAISFLFLPILTIAQTKEKFHNNYDSKKSAFDNFTSGFANEFFEYGDKFRIRAKDTGNGNENPMLLEKMENKKWTFVDSFSYSYCFSHSVFCTVKDKDLNKDGVKDFIIEYGKWSKISLVYKYDKTKKNLIRVGFFSEKPQRVIGYKNLFYDIWYDKWNEWSYIYTIRNSQRINLGIAELKVKVKFKNEENVAVPQYISIRQFTDTGENEIKKIGTQKVKEFSYKKYWTDNARLFYYSKNKRLISISENYYKRFEPME